MTTCEGMGVGVTSALASEPVKNKREMGRVVGFLSEPRNEASEESFESGSVSKEEVWLERVLGKEGGGVLGG